MFKKLKIILHNHLGLNKSEANGLIILVAVVLLTAIAPRIYFRYFYKPSFPTYSSTKVTKWLDTIKEERAEPDKTLTSRKEPSKPIDKTKKTPVSFAFDPNKISADSLELLGFKSYVADRLVKFRKAGGEFKTADDLSKIYGINQVRVKDLQDYIFIREKELGPAVKKIEEQKKSAAIIKTDINRATSSDLQKIRGIGPSFSTRIIKYRDLLGGYHSIDQLREVYHLPDSLLPAIEKHFFIDGSIIKQVEINRFATDSLRQHPYIDYNLARAIVRYRQMHGPYKSPESIKSIKLISDSLYQKLYPYLSSKAN